jgi:hypothetical protein
MTVEIGSINGEVIDIPVAVHDWGESGARWTAHPSLSQKLKAIISAADPYMKTSEIHSRFTIALGDSMIYGSKSPDLNCLDPRAAKRGAFKLRLAILPKELLARADVTPQSFTDAIFEQLAHVEVGRNPGNGKQLQISLSSISAYIVGIAANGLDSRSFSTVCIGSEIPMQGDEGNDSAIRNMRRKTFQTQLAHNLTSGWIRTGLVSIADGSDTNATAKRSLPDQRFETKSWLRRKIIFPLLTYLIVAILVLLLQSIWGLAITSMKKILLPTKATEIQGALIVSVAENSRNIDLFSNVR